MMKAYTEYKDSGVQWLGDIPVEWHVASTRIGFSSISNGTTATQVEEATNIVPVSRIETISKGVIDKNKTGNISIDSAEDRYLLKSGDILFSNINSLPMVGNIAQVTDDDFLYHGMNLLRLQPATILEKKYAYWVLKSKYYRSMVEAHANPAINQASISVGVLKSIPFAFPEINMQKAISLFLDSETARIDNLISEKENFIKLLSEKRQALISHVVTKGLNPNVPMKDSGVEWIGEIPEHWSITKAAWIGRLFSSEGVADEDVSDSGDLPFIKVSSLALDNFSLQEVKFFLDSNKKKYRKEKDFIAFPKRGAAIFNNKVNYIDIESLIDPNLMGWKINVTHNPFYICYLIKLMGLSGIADVSSVPQINNKHINPLKFPSPNKDEQDEIVNYLDQRLEKIESLVNETKKSIELLKEHRTALISAAVTGKIDVREEV